MHTIFVIGAGDHTLIARDEDSGDDHQFRAKSIQVPIAPDNLNDFVKAADELAMLVEHQHTYFLMLSNTASDTEEKDRYLKDANRAKSILDGYREKRS